MDSKDVKQTEETAAKDVKQDVKPVKGQPNVKLLALVAAVGCFAYIYFFTDLIKPQVENKPAEAPVVLNEKKVLPPRDGSVVKVDGTSAVAPATAEPVKVVPAAVEPVKAAPVAPVQQPKAKEEPKKAEPVKPVEKKTVAVAPVVKEKKQPVAKKPETKPEVAEAAAKTGSWVVLAGNYVLEGTLAHDQAKIKKAGLEPVIKSAGRKKTMMNRLLLVELTDRSAAKAELEKLKKHTSDAFIMDHSGKYYVYAGSYVLDSRAASEKERLSAAGFSLTLKREEVSIPSKNLTAGIFSDKKAAEAAVRKLKEAGIKATLRQQ